MIEGVKKPDQEWLDNLQVLQEQLEQKADAIDSATERLKKRNDFVFVPKDKLVEEEKPRE